VALLNSLLRPAFAAMLMPFAVLPPIVGLTVLSLLTAILMLVIFRLTSNQDRLAEVKDAIHACLFEIRLFNDDLRAIFRAQNEILRHNLSYLRLSLVPMVWILPPVVLIIAHLNPYYAYEGFDIGSSFVLTARLDPAAEASTPVSPAIELQAPDGIRIETPPVWVAAEDEMSWRLVADRAGAFDLTIVVDSTRVAKSVWVAKGQAPRSPLKVRNGFMDQLLYPVEELLPEESPVHAITVNYPEGEIEVFGFEMHWLVVFFVLSIVFAFALKKPLGVTI
jgi:uncharacterized membrane protein (DUF106 family)